MVRVHDKVEAHQVRIIYNSDNFLMWNYHLDLIVNYN
jgi:hypothetical protein